MRKAQRLKSAISKSEGIKRKVEMGKYDDIINHARHRSGTRRPMNQRDRAAQFAPFAALTGYDDSVCEAARLTDEKTELGEVQTDDMNVRLSFLAAHIAENPEITVTYFEADTNKAGGAFLTVSGRIKKIDKYERKLVFTDNSTFSFDDISNIQCELFPADWD